jgi:hypothetical protein
MGMYDYVRCDYPLPVDGANGLEFQTKDTAAQCLDKYEIREDGTLWHAEYDTEDRSNPNATGLMRFVGCMTRVNERWVFEPMTGEVRFYSSRTGKYEDGSWVEFSAYFEEGKLRELHTLDDRAPNAEITGG